MIPHHPAWLFHLVVFSFVSFHFSKCPFLHAFSLPLHRMPLSSIYSSVSPFDPLNVLSAGKPFGIKTSWTSTCGTTGGTAAVTCAISVVRASWRTRRSRITCSCTLISAPTPASSVPSPMTDWTCSKCMWGFTWSTAAFPVLPARKPSQTSYRCDVLTNRCTHNHKAVSKCDLSVKSRLKS